MIYKSWVQLLMMAKSYHIISSKVDIERLTKHNTSTFSSVSVGGFEWQNKIFLPTNQHETIKKGKEGTANLYS